jgi:bacterioferritin (cytochrome b1)
MMEEILAKEEEHAEDLKTLIDNIAGDESLRPSQGTKAA